MAPNDHTEGRSSELSFEVFFGERFSLGMLKSIVLLLGDLRISFERIYDLWLPGAQIVFFHNKITFRSDLGGVDEKSQRGYPVLNCALLKGSSEP